METMKWWGNCLVYIYKKFYYYPGYLGLHAFLFVPLPVKIIINDVNLPQLFMHGVFILDPQIKFGVECEAWGNEATRAVRGRQCVKKI